MLDSTSEEGVVDQMTDYELLRIINFLEQIRAPYDQLQAANPDPVWNIVLYLMKSHLRGDMVTMSSLASVSRIPFASAMRRIHRLIEDGYIEQYSRNSSAKSFYLAPSRRLKSNFTSYAMKVKVLLAETFGLGKGSAKPDDYYFGGAYMVDQVIPPLKIMESRLRPTQEIRFLLHDDNYFVSMRNMWSDFRSKLASRKSFTLLALPELHQELFRNVTRKESEYDVICINMPWLGEAVKDGIAQPLNEFLADSGMNPTNYFQPAPGV